MAGSDEAMQAAWRELAERFPALASATTRLGETPGSRTLYADVESAGLVREVAGAYGVVTTTYGHARMPPHASGGENITFCTVRLGGATVVIEAVECACQPRCGTAPAPSPDSLSAGTLSERAELRHRSAADQCLYLAAKLAEHGGGSLAASLAVSLALPVLAGEIKDTADRAGQLVAIFEQWHEPTPAYVREYAANYGQWMREALALLREVSR